MIEAGCRFRFAAKAFHVGGRSQAARQDHLQCDRPIQTELPSGTDSHPASGNLLDQLEVAKTRGRAWRGNGGWRRVSIGRTRLARCFQELARRFLAQRCRQTLEMLLVGEELLQGPGEFRMLQEDRLSVRALARLDGRQVIRNDGVKPFLFGQNWIGRWIGHGGTRRFPQAFHPISFAACPQPGTGT